jgi:hypothetical protein
MSRLRSRIAAQPGNSRAAAAGYHPAGTPDTPMVMPLVRVNYYGGGIAVDQVHGLLTAGGAVIPATAPGAFGQVHMAGRP